MSRFLLLMLLLSSSSFAQFFGLATPADGSRVYFATPLRQKATPQPTYGKLFQVDAGGLRLRLVRELIPAPAEGGLTNPYDILSTDVSSDGQVLAVGGRRSCVGDAVWCGKHELFATTIVSGNEARDYPGRLKLSASGKWAFGEGSQGNIMFNPAGAYLANLATGDVTAIDGRKWWADFPRAASAGRPVADNGDAVFTGASGVILLRGAEARIIPAPAGSSALEAVIDSSGRIIVYSARSHATQISELRIVTPDAGGSDLLVPRGYAPSLSDDGKQALYLSDRAGVPQAFLIRTDGSGDQQLTTEPDGIAQAILSGGGVSAYAVTYGGKLLKISIDPRSVDELIPRTPFLASPPLLAPGKLVTFEGAGFSPASVGATLPLPFYLGGVGVLISSRQARLLSVEPASITLVVPPDVPIGQPASIRLDVDSASYFEVSDATASTAREAPEFFVGPPNARRPGRYILTAHQDWRGVVSDEDPAQPGEVLHTYAAGLGETSPAVPYGVAAPAQEPFARVLAGFECSDGSSPIDVLFAGLAPELVAVYQIDWRVPAEVKADVQALHCQTSGGGQTQFGFVPVGAEGIAAKPLRRLERTGRLKRAKILPDRFRPALE